MTTRERVDRLLVARGLFESRARAQAAIAAGRVTADGSVVRKASEEISSAADIVAQPEHPYVSRGGVKLALDPARLAEPPDFATVDVSFISLKLVLPAVGKLLAPRAQLLALIKPQFETSRGHLKKGIVRDEAVHKAICEDIGAFTASLGWRVGGVVASAIRGGDGNREFFIAAERG
jgi:predicted rRNA methylase YqxC with S4 and FtsJ domains